MRGFIVLYVLFGFLLSDNAASFLREVFWPVSFAWRNWDLTQWFLLVAFIIGGAWCTLCYTPQGKRFTAQRERRMRESALREQELPAE